MLKSCCQVELNVSQLMGDTSGHLTSDNYKSPREVAARERVEGVFNAKVRAQKGSVDSSWQDRSYSRLLGVKASPLASKRRRVVAKLSSKKLTRKTILC